MKKKNTFPSSLLPSPPFLFLLFPSHSFQTNISLHVQWIKFTWSDSWLMLVLSISFIEGTLVILIISLGSFHLWIESYKVKLVWPGWARASPWQISSSALPARNELSPAPGWLVYCPCQTSGVCSPWHMDRCLVLDSGRECHFEHLSNFNERNMSTFSPYIISQHIRSKS